MPYPLELLLRSSHLVYLAFLQHGLLSIDVADTQPHQSVETTRATSDPAVLRGSQPTLLPLSCASSLLLLHLSPSRPPAALLTSTCQRRPVLLQSPRPCSAMLSIFQYSLFARRLVLLVLALVAHLLAAHAAAVHDVLARLALCGESSDVHAGCRAVRRVSWGRCICRAAGRGTAAGG